VLTPHRYQERVIRELVERRPCALLSIEPGLGKTMMALRAFDRLREELVVSRALVVAPLRVCLTTWPEEMRLWTPHLRWAYVGDGAREALAGGAEIVLVNPERLHELFGAPDKKRSRWVPGPWKDAAAKPEMLIVDECTKMKRTTGVRARTLGRYLGDFARRVAMTGTVAPNGYEDLHGQVYLVDRGEALDHRVTYFRRRFFDERMGRGHRPIRSLKDGADEQIREAVAHLTIALHAEDYLELPSLVQTDVPVALPAEAHDALDSLRTEGGAEYGGVEMLGDSDAKRRQIIGGVAYDDQGRGHVLHTAKLDALDDLLEEIGRGHPAMVAYEFRAQRDTIQIRLEKRGLRVATLGGGVGKAAAEKAIQDWNAGRLDVLLLHPAAAGHGLNLQAGGNIVIWLSPPWDLEAYLQLNARLFRQGQRASRVFVYHLVARGTTDVRVDRVLRSKNATQQALTQALKEEPE